MKFELNIRSTENSGVIDEEKKRHFTEIFEALIFSGGLTGVKGGSTCIHFDGEGRFMGINLNYWPFRKRRT